MARGFRKMAPLGNSLGHEFGSSSSPHRERKREGSNSPVGSAYSSNCYKLKGEVRRILLLLTCLIKFSWNIAFTVIPEPLPIPRLFVFQAGQTPFLCLGR